MVEDLSLLQVSRDSSQEEKPDVKQKWAGTRQNLQGYFGTREKNPEATYVSHTVWLQQQKWPTGDDGAFCQKSAHVSGPRLEEIQREFKDVWTQLLNPADGVDQKISNDVCKIQLCPVPYISLQNILATSYLLTSPSHTNPFLPPNNKEKGFLGTPSHLHGTKHTHPRYTGYILSSRKDKVNVRPQNLGDKQNW